MFFKVIRQEPISELPEGWTKIHEHDGVTYVRCDTSIKSPIKTLMLIMNTDCSLEQARPPLPSESSY